jgi:hypothetical protein
VIEETGFRRVALTDDEVVALAARSDRLWPSALPTIDPSDDAAIEKAINRGARSLVARELLVTEGKEHLNAALAELIDPILSGRATIGTYVASRELEYLPSEFGTACYEAGDGTWVNEIVSGIGIHYLSSGRSSTCLGAIEEMVKRVVSSGYPSINDEVPDSRVLCVVGPPSQESVRLAMVEKGEITAVRLKMPKGSTEQLGTLRSPAAALDFVIRMDTRGLVSRGER